MILDLYIKRYKDDTKVRCFFFLKDDAAVYPKFPLNTIHGLFNSVLTFKKTKLNLSPTVCYVEDFAKTPKEDILCISKLDWNIET